MKSTPDDFSEKIFEKGFSIYEVIRIFNGKPLFLRDNLTRLEESVKKAGQSATIDFALISEKIARFIAEKGIQEGNIKYVLHFIDGRTDEYLYSIPHSYPSDSDYKSGVEVLSLRATRKHPQIKYIDPELRNRTNELIKKQGVYEIVLIDDEGYITEGSRSNVFFIRENTCYTAPVSEILSGTSRKRIINICKEHHLNLKEEPIVYADLNSFDAAFISGTSPLILPIRKMDDVVFDVNNPLLRELMRIYFAQLGVNNISFE